MKTFGQSITISSPTQSNYALGGYVSAPTTITDPLQEIKDYVKYLEDCIVDLEGRVDELESQASPESHVESQDE